MNDFTKEELEEIKRCVVYMTRGGTTPYSLFTLELKKKIISMIENYDQPTSYYEKYRNNTGEYTAPVEPAYTKIFIDGGGPGMDVTLKDGRKFKCSEMKLEGPGGSGGTGRCTCGGCNGNGVCNCDVKK